MRRISILSCLALVFLVASSHIVRGQKQIVIGTKNSSLVLTTDKEGKLYQSHLGRKLSASSEKELSNVADVESYIPAGGSSLFEPAIRVVHADGNPSLELRFVDYKIQKVNDDNTITSITLTDPVYPVKVVLNFSSFYNEDVIKSWTEISHQEAKPIRLTNFASSMLHVNAEHYWLTQFHGDWAKEAYMQESELTSGIKIIDSKLGSRADMYQTPTFMLALNNKATENKGELVAGTLGWTGNFQFAFELDEHNRLRMIAGMNPFASDYVLDAGKILTTPEFIFTYSAEGKGKASRNLHNWARNYGVMDGKGSRYTLLNNWEATQFNFDEKKLELLFGETKQLGVDMFLLDDGWFGNKYPRNSDNAGLGDWQENKKKLPNGIGHLVREATNKGVKFGIWIEPEMVNPKSELYEKHPDWILKLPNRKEDYFRNQLVLDLVNPKVQQFVYDMVDNMLTKNAGIAYIKWDCNRMMTNTYSPYLKERQSNTYIDYVKGLYSVLEKLRQKYPTLPMMLCSGGGGRTDYGALKYFTEFWPSDNTNAYDRIFIQWGYSYFFPAKTLACHVTSWGNQSLKFRTDVAMMGRLGFDIDVEKMTKDELQFSQNAVQYYKRLSPVIWNGDMYRLVAPYNNERAALMYVDSMQSHAVLFSYTMHPRYGTDWTAVKLEGLDPDKLYTVKEINLFPGSRSEMVEDGKQYTGQYLMTVGLNVSSSRELTSSIVEITQQ